MKRLNVTRVSPEIIGGRYHQSSSTNCFGTAEVTYGATNVIKNKWPFALSEIISVGVIPSVYIYRSEIFINIFLRHVDN